MPNLPKLAFIVLSPSLLLAGCRPRTPSVMLYEKDGLQFSRLSDWNVTKDAPIAAVPGSRSIDVEGPGHAIITLICEPGAGTQTLDWWAHAVSAGRTVGIEKRFKIGSFRAGTETASSWSTSTEMIAGQQRRGVAERFSIKLLGLMSPTEAQYYSVEGVRYRALILYQVPEDSLEFSRPGERLILSTIRIP